MVEDRKRGTVPCWILSVVLLLTTLAAPASASQRVALVIGNAAYEHAPPLTTPLNDASGIGAALARLGYSVTRVDNADHEALRRGLHDFALAARAAEAAVVYYAGHGIAVGQRNFLVPVDARLSSDRDVEFEAVPLGLVERAVGGASGARLIFLDASQQSPFPATIGPGLARIEPSAGTLVASATKERTVAFDANDRNSLFTEVLLRHLEEPGLTVMQLIREVRKAVLAATGGKQEPSVYGSLSDSSAYLGPRPAYPAEAPAPETSTVGGTGEYELTAEKLAAERLYWTSVKDSDDPVEIKSYLDRYPNGTYATLARARLKRLDSKTGSIERTRLV